MSRPMFRALAAIAIAGMALFAVASACAANWIVVPGQPSRVVFESKAPMETFSGQTDQISGAIELDPSDISDVITVQLEVEMASFDTGISLRDKHMRDNHLHTEEFPKALFIGGKLSELSERELVEGGRINGVIEGELELHGVRRQETARFEMQLSGGLLRIVARFAITLGDYDIPRPRFLMMKLGEKQAVTVDLVAKPQ